MQDVLSSEGATGAARRSLTSRCGASAPVEPTAASPQLQMLRLRDWAERPRLDSEWHALLERAERGSVFQTYEWHRCWWQAFGEPHELLLIAAYASSRLVGVAPMMVLRSDPAHSRWRQANEICFIGSCNGASDYCDFIVDPGFPCVLEAMLDRMCRESRTAIVRLSHMPAGSPLLQPTVAHLRRRGLRPQVQLQNFAPVRVLRDSAADRAVANKAGLRRRTRYFERAGELGFVRCATATQILEQLEAFFAQHVARRALTQDQSQFLDPAQRRFYKELVRRLAPKGWLRFDMVLFNGVPLAFHLGFEYRKRFIWYKPTFDVRFAKHSPGQVLIRHLLNIAIDGRLEEFDFTVGAEPFKYRFANETRRVERVIAFRSKTAYWRHRLEQSARRLLRPVLGPVRRWYRRGLHEPIGAGSRGTE